MTMAWLFDNVKVGQNIIFQYYDIIWLYFKYII